MPYHASVPNLHMRVRQRQRLSNALVCDRLESLSDQINGSTTLPTCLSVTTYVHSLRLHSKGRLR